MFEPARRGKCADLVIGINVNRAAIGDRGVNIANARGVAFTCDAVNARADAELPLPVVRAMPAVVPTATLFDPVVLARRAPGPVAVLKFPMVLL